MRALRGRSVPFFRHFTAFFLHSSCNLPASAPHPTCILPPHFLLCLEGPSRDDRAPRPQVKARTASTLPRSVWESERRIDDNGRRRPVSARRRARQTTRRSNRRANNPSPVNGAEEARRRSSAPFTGLGFLDRPF